MIFHGLDICCPFCKREIRQLNEEKLQCVECSRSYPVIFGIPDLRIFSDPYISFEEDRAKALHLASHFDELSFEELVRFYYLTTPVVPQHHARQYLRGILSAESRAGSMFQEWERMAGLLGDQHAPFIEVGCGTAPLLVAAGKRYKTWLGVDIALRWLIVAKKRLQQHDLDAPLICACAEALPFTDKVFEITAFDSTLEVVRDQRTALREAYRILKPGGTIVVITPNRYSPGPDPHINLWAGGYLPESWIAAYARRQKAIPPKRNLLSARSLVRLIRDSGFKTVHVTVPPIAKGQAKQLPGIFRGLVKVYNMSRHAPIVGSIFRSIGPLLQATAQKPEDPSR